ncbi:aspartate/glutamate racemase family protein [Phyllobacterium sophorae]|nr:aspartate/glutamate racemase family protein [Phyllobacterium sophorae]
MMKIALLHTAESNISIFQKAASEIGLPQGALHHEVRADLLAAAEKAGGLTQEIARETGAALLELARNADAVVLACSTLGPAIAEVENAIEVPVLRVDAALAKKAVKSGGLVVAICAVETTRAPTTRLFTEAAQSTGAQVEIRLVPGAWELFKTGDRAGYLAAIAEAAEAAYDDGATIVALAQASMAGAADLVANGPKPLSSPTAGLAAAVELLSMRS